MGETDKCQADSKTDMAKYASVIKGWIQSGKRLQCKEGKNGIGGRNEKKENKSKKKDDKED